MPGVVPTAALGLLLATVSLAQASDPARHAGRVHSSIPAEGVLVIEVLGAGSRELVEVDVRDAEVVRVWRDPERPWEWLERPARLQRLSVGTFVVVIGRYHGAGAVEADRVEVPEVEP